MTPHPAPSQPQQPEPEFRFTDWAML